MGGSDELYYIALLSVMTFLIVYFGLNWVFKYYTLPKMLFKHVFKIHHHRTQITIVTICFIMAVFSVSYIVDYFVGSDNLMICSMINGMLLGILNTTSISLKA